MPNPEGFTALIVGDVAPRLDSGGEPGFRPGAALLVAKQWER